MAVELLMRRTLQGLAPADDDATEALKAIKQGAEVKCEVRVARSSLRNRWYWALCGLIAENSTRWPTKEAASDTLKMGCGVFNEVHIKRNGDWFVLRTPGSIAFRNMEEPQFREFCLRAENYAATEMLECEPKQLSEALEQFMLGGRRAA